MMKNVAVAPKPISRLDVLQDEVNELKGSVERLDRLINHEKEFDALHAKRSTNGHTNGHTNGKTVAEPEVQKRTRKPKVEAKAEPEEKVEPEAVPEGLERFVRATLKSGGGGTAKEIASAAKAKGHAFSAAQVKTYLKVLEGKGKATQDDDRKWTST